MQKNHKILLRKITEDLSRVRYTYYILCLPPYLHVGYIEGEESPGVGGDIRGT